MLRLLGLLELAHEFIRCLIEVLRPLAFAAVLAHGRWTLDVVNTNVSGVG
jgi:hypothetical protein